MLNHTEFQVKGFGLGMKLFDQCLSLRESPKLPVLLINNSTGAIIISKNVMHYIHDGHLTLLTSHHVAWWSGEGHIDAWKCWRSQYLRPQPRTDVTAPKVVDLPGHYINFGLICRITLRNLKLWTQTITVIPWDAYKLQFVTNNLKNFPKRVLFCSFMTMQGLTLPRRHKTYWRN